MKISFNPSNSNKNILDLIKNNKDIIFDLKGHSIFARGVEFKGTDTNTWRPVVDNLTSDSTTSSLSAKQGKVLKALIDGKSNSDHNHDGRYLKLTGGTMASNALITFADSGSWDTSKKPQGARGGLYWTGQSDYAKLYAEETVGDNLDLVIQFGDDNSNGLSIRNKANTQTSYISAGGVITTGTFKGNLDWSYITNKPASYTPSAHTHAWNSLTHSSTTENQAILTNGKANGWKLYTLNISRWDNAANNAHSHANKSALDGITSALVNSWNTAYNFVSNITGTDTDKVINKWEEIVNFLAGITEDNKLNTLLNSKLSVYELADNTNVGTIKNNGIYYSTTDASSRTLINSPFNTGFAFINMTSYDGGDDLRRSRLAFNAFGEIKVSDDRDLANTTETWYNVLTSKNSGISGSTIKLNGTSITVYSSGTADGRYVKKSGDTMSGVLTIDTTNFGALTIKRNDDANGASIQFRGKSSVYGYIGLNNSTKDKLFLRWSSDISRVYTILDTSSTYISNGKGVINGTTITQVDNATNSTNSTNARKLVNWYSARPTSLNAQFGDGSLRIFYATSSTTEGKPAEDSHILHLAWDNTGGYDAQLAVHARSGKVSTRAQNGGTWQPWKTLAFTTDIPSSLKNPYSFNVFGVVYDGSAAKTVTTSTFVSLLPEGTSTVTDGTMFITSWASNSGFADTNAVNVPYKRKAIHLWEYIKAKTDSLYATKGHNHDGRYVRAFGTSNDNIDSDWGQSFKTFDPIPLGTPPEKNPNISLLSIGENFNRRKLLAFIWNNDNIYYRRHIDSGFTNWRRLAFANEIPTSLKNPYALTISLNGTSQGPYDGSAAKNINITPGSIGAAVSNHSHDYLVVNSADDKSFNSAYHNFLVLYAGGGNGITGKPANVDAFGLFKFRAASGWSGQMLLANGGSLYIRSSEDAKMTNTLAWKTILDSSNYSGILDSRYYTESEVNSLLDAKLNRQNLSYGNWNPRGYHLAADYHYNGGDLSISESGGKIHVSVDGYFWLNEGLYRVLDTSDISGIRGRLTLSQYLSATDAAWYPLVWGGNAHINTSDSTGAVYKSYDKLSWQTSSLTLYATNIQTNNIKNLSIGGGIYWNSYVESASDGSDAASITLVRSGVAGGTTLVLSLMNDTNDTILFKTNTAARLYHNSYPILTTLNTYVSNNKGYINGLEITLVNNADTLDGAHASRFPIYYNLNMSSTSNNWYKLGTARISESDNIMIHIYSGNGWNSNAFQNAYATLMIKTGYNPNGGLTREFGATMVNHHHSNMTYKLISPSNNTVDIWVKIPWGYSSGWYSIHGEYSSYTHSGASQSAEPTGNAQTGVETLTNAYTSSNVASATKLATPRTIWGQSFDGTADVNGTIYINNSNSTNGAIRLNNNINSNARISAIDSQVIFNTGNAIRFGGTAWDWNQWAGLKYEYSNKTIYLGIADGSIFTANSAQSGGTLSLTSINTLQFGVQEAHIGYNGSYSDPWAGLSTNFKFGGKLAATHIYSNEGFYKNGSSNSYVLLGGGGHKLESSLNVAYSNLTGITLTGGNGNNEGYRLIFEKTMGGWTINYGVWAIAFRHSGRGTLNIGFDTTNSDGSTYRYNIRFLGSTVSRESTPFRAFYNNTTKVFRIYWHYYDYTSGDIAVLRGNMEPHNGTWMASLPNDVGTELAITCNMADLAANADTVDGYHASAFSYKSWWHWYGKDGQPNWLWGGNNENDYYVYNPSNFRVAYAASAGNADTLDGYPANGSNDRPYGHIPTIESDGVMEVGRYIDFHNDNNGKHDFSTRLQSTGNYGNEVNLPSASGTLALINDVNNYYWANVKISTSSSTTTSPTVLNLTATNSIRMGNILLEHTNEINNSANDSIHLNLRNSGNVSLCYGGGNVGIGTTTPSYKLDVNGLMRASGFHHSSVNSDNYILLAGGGYKSFGGDDSTPIFLGCLDLYRGGDGTISSSFYCLGYSVPFTYTRGGNYCKIVIPDTTRLSFYIIAATASVNYSGGGMDTWTGYHRGSGAWWLHCYAFGWNEVRVKGFCQADKNNDSWWGGNPLWNNEYGANRITVCIFGHVKYK